MWPFLFSTNSPKYRSNYSILVPEIAYLAMKSQAFIINLLSSFHRVPFDRPFEVHFLLCLSFFSICQSNRDQTSKLFDRKEKNCEVYLHNYNYLMLYLLNGVKEKLNQIVQADVELLSYVHLVCFYENVMHSILNIYRLSFRC